MKFLTYPRPIPRITLIAIITLVVVAIAAFIMNLCVPNQHISLAGGLPYIPALTGGEKIAVNIMALVIELLLIWGLCTGRKLILRLVVLKLVAAWIMHIQGYVLYQHITSHLMMMLSYAGLGFLTAAVILILFVPASRKWFSACEDVRVKHRGGKKFNPWLVRIIIIACVLIVISLYNVVFKSHINTPVSTKNTGYATGIIKGLPGGLCDGYFKSPRAKILLSQHGVTSKTQCIRFVMPMVHQCASHYKRSFITQMNFSQSVEWANKVGECAADKLSSL